MACLLRVVCYNQDLLHIWVLFLLTFPSTRSMSLSSSMSWHCCSIKVTSHLQRPKKSIFLLFDKTEFKHLTLGCLKKKFLKSSKAPGLILRHPHWNRLVPLSPPWFAVWGEEIICWRGANCLQTFISLNLAFYLGGIQNNKQNNTWSLSSATTVKARGTFSHTILYSKLGFCATVWLHSLYHKNVISKLHQSWSWTVNSSTTQKV